MVASIYLHVILIYTICGISHNKKKKRKLDTYNMKAKRRNAKLFGQRNVYFYLFIRNM